MHLKAHKVTQQGCFSLSLFSCELDDQLSPNFHRFVILCITPSENAGLWQLHCSSVCPLLYTSVYFNTFRMQPSSLETKRFSSFKHICSFDPTIWHELCILRTGGSNLANRTHQFYSSMLIAHHELCKIYRILTTYTLTKLEASTSTSNPEDCNLIQFPWSQQVNKPEIL